MKKIVGAASRRSGAFVFNTIQKLETDYGRRRSKASIMLSGVALYICVPRDSA